MFYRLFLDDVRHPKDVKWVNMPPGPWVIARNYDEFVKIVTEKGVPGFVAFDHDLADEHYRQSMYNPDKHYSGYYTDGTFKEMTGFGCAQWLVEYCMDNKQPFPDHVVHSMNPIGKENIDGYIASYKRSLL